MPRHPSRARGPADILEQGDIFFFRRSQGASPGGAGDAEPAAGGDMDPLVLVLRPGRQERYRFFALGRRRLPPPLKSGGPARSGERFSVHVDLLPDPASLRAALAGSSPAGDGVYALARHGDHAHLAYALKHPDRAGPFQRALGIEDEASYIVSVKNPEYIESADGPEYPPALASLFRERKYIPADPPALLDFPGAELLLIAVRRAVGRELGISLEGVNAYSRP